MDIQYSEKAKFFKPNIFNILNERKANAAKIKMATEAWMNTIPQRMQRIIRYKIFDKMSWKETADKLGRGATADGVRMEFKKFMKN